MLMKQEDSKIDVDTDMPATFGDVGSGSDSSSTVNSCDTNKDASPGFVGPLNNGVGIVGVVDEERSLSPPSSEKSTHDVEVQAGEGTPTNIQNMVEEWIQSSLSKHPLNEAVKTIQEELGMLYKHVQQFSPQSPPCISYQSPLLGTSVNSSPGVSASEERHQLNKEPSITSTSLVLRRSLLGSNPSSLEDLLGASIKTNNGGKYRDAFVQTEGRSLYTFSPQLQPPPSPSLQLVSSVFKQEHDDSFHKNNDSKPKLLSLLADAAFALGGQSKPSLTTTEILSDSGRSSEQCSSVGSPAPASNHCDTPKSLSKGMYRIVKRGSSDTKLKIILPRPSSPEGSGSDERQLEISETETKLVGRKRRKTKHPLPCNHCGKLFNNQSSLRQHESFHLPDRPFQCKNEKCDKAYKTRSELNRHLAVHSGEKKHICKLCSKRFLRKQYLKTHLLRHHETGLTMMASSNAGNFQRSLMSVERSEFSNHAEPLTWRCNLCLKIFSHVENLAKHVRSYHKKKRPLVTMKQEMVPDNCGSSSMEVVPHAPAPTLSSTA